MGGLWLVVRTDARRRWPSIVVLTILVALAGGFVMTAATGARRAESALGRFLDATEMFDGSIEVDYPATEAVTADVVAQPEVAATSAAVFIPLVSDEIETGVIAGLTPTWLRDVYVPRIVAGRLPDPKRVNELLVNEDTAERHALVPGDEVVLEDYLGLEIKERMTIVGIHRGVIDLALSDAYPGALATQAFGRRVGGALFEAIADRPEADRARPMVLARMHAGVDDPVRVLAGVAERHADARPGVASRSPFVTPIDRALAVQVEAFWVLTAVAAVSALMLLGIAVARFASSSTHHDATLRAVGFTSRERALSTLAAPMVVVIVGCALAVAGAVLASPLVPLGSARLVEPDPGVWVDPWTMIVGGLGMAAGLIAIATAVVLVGNPNARRKPRSARAAARLPLPATLGQDLAYRESGWGRLALAAVGIGVGLVVSVSVYSASLDRLKSTTSLFGSDYEVVLFAADGADPEQPFADVDLDDPRIESAAVSWRTQLKVAGDTVVAQVIDPVRGVPGGTVLDGRAPGAENEVALGPSTADRLGLSVGDDITVTGARERSMRIVGEAVLPIQEGAYGDVMWLTSSAAEHLGTETHEPTLLVNLAEGVTQDELVTAVRDTGVFDLALPVPDNVSNLDDVGHIPTVLAIFGALLSGAVLAFALFGIARRRRRDLAVLRTLGLRPPQIRTSMLVASLLIVGPGAAIGVAVGVVLGRGYWTSVAAGVPAVGQPVVPLAMTAIVVLGALALGCLLVAGPARLAMRIRPTEILQRD